MVEKDLPSYPVNRKSRKWPAFLIALVVLMVLAYPIAGNFMLYTGTLERIISKKPEKLNLTWDNAWTLWPGKIHVGGFDLDIHTRKNRIQVQIEKAVVQLDLLPLTEKKIRITSVDAEGLKVSHVKRTKDSKVATTTTENSTDTVNQESAESTKPVDKIDSPPKKKKKPRVVDLKGVRTKRL